MSIKTWIKIIIAMSLIILGIGFLWLAIDVHAQVTLDGQSLDPAQDVEIRWAGSAWETIPADSVEVLDGNVTGTHKHWGAIGSWTFECNADVDQSSVQRFRFVIAIDTIPDGVSFVLGNIKLSVFEVRVRKRAVIDGQLSDPAGPWSEPSPWCGILQIGSTGNPIKL